MIAELALANAAFSVIKEAVQNSGDLMAAGQHLFSYFDNKTAIQKKYEKKAKGSNGNDLEEFMALEQLKKQEAELKQMMIYHGRGGLWDDWLRFQSEAKKKRAEAEKAEIRKAIARKAKMWLTLMWAAIVSLMGVLALISVWVLDQLKYRN
jgi:hypothetical protein